MIFVLRALIFLASAAIGMLVADLVLPGFHINWRNWWGFVLAIVIFAVLQSILAPLLTRIAKRRAPVLLGGIGIVSTFVALLIVVLVPGAGLGITGVTGWIVGPLIVWLVTAIATLLLTPVFIRRKPAEK